MSTHRTTTPTDRSAVIDRPARRHESEEDAMNTNTLTTAPLPTRYLDVPGGRVAYDYNDAGDGPLVICVPGLGDLRASYRFLAPHLAAAGYHVATMDLRGHGDSSVGWADYGYTAIAGDALALVRALDAGPAILVGNSYGGAAVAYAAATDPAAVRALVLLDAFVRDAPLSLVQRLGVQAIAALGVSAWAYYYKSLFKATPPADLAAYVATLKANLKEPGRYDATRAMLLPSVQGGHAAVSARLGDVVAPALVVMGSADPDFPDPAEEARLSAEALRGAASVQIELVAGAGHYPHVESPAVVGPAVVAFLARAGAAVESSHGA